MLKTTASNSKKNALLARKEQLLQEIKYYETRIQEFPTKTPLYYYDGNGSSDSEDDLPTLDIGPSITELKQQEHLLRTCLQATQELTGVGVLQSEVNVMVKDPVLEGEKPVSEPGTWREVTAECRIDLVPFSITFYTHQPSRKFAPKSYRSLRVLPVKTVQEAELSNSILPSLTRPSDAVEVLRSYAVAYRSRRSTLARLADKYATSLFMEPLAEGGFTLKCANLLEMSWRLENQLSPVAPFHHKMNFQLEYMDESYLKVIKQTHHQLSDPSLQTDERTLLLAKIIGTCLEAHGPAQELYESMESDPESVKRLEKTILDEDSDDESAKKRNEQQTHKRKRDAEVMAPPKVIPKKAKPKGKENMDENRKSVKRSSQVDAHDAKKARIDGTNDENTVTDIIRSEMSNVSTKNKKKTGANQKNSEKEKEHVEKAQKQKENDKINDKSKRNEGQSTKLVNEDENASKNKVKLKETVVTQGNVKNSDINTKKVSKNGKATKSQVKTSDVNKNTVSTKNVNKDIAENNESTEPNAKKIKESMKNGSENSKMAKTAKNDAVNNKSVVNKNAEAIEKNGSTGVVNTKNYEKNTQSSKAKAKPTKTINSKNSDDNLKKNGVSDPTNVKKSVNSNTANLKKNVDSDPSNPKKGKHGERQSVYSEPTNVRKTMNSDPGNSNNNSYVTNVKTSVRSDPTNAKKNINSNINKNANGPKSTTVEKNTKISNIATKNKDHVAESNTKSVTAIPKDINVARIENTTAKGAAKKNIFAADNTKIPLPKNHPTYKNSTAFLPANQENTKKMLLKNHRNSSGKPPKKSISKNLKPIISDESRGSKIPQKKLSPAYAAVLKKNPIRMSPRVMSKFKSPSDSDIQSKLSKPGTNIPRLLEKLVSK